ncbi:hypothetical protein ACFQJC_15395 [Haloferax namakaokahaiae]|uniref:DUF3592 domain-containing protein n=1 Tax=Haloferax namakaokahaiae TaxID=1748331 RepID=A0ABD5ZHY2_9EURY
MTSRLQVVALVISLALLGFGILGYGFFGDTDYTYQFDHETTEAPERVQPSYDSLSATQREYVDRALDGETLRFEEDPERLPRIVERDEVYYHFDFEENRDYTDPTTLLPLSMSLAGLIGLVATIRWEVTSRYVTY